MRIDNSFKGKLVAVERRRRYEMAYVLSTTVTCINTRATTTIATTRSSAEERKAMASGVICLGGPVTSIAEDRAERL